MAPHPALSAAVHRQVLGVCCAAILSLPTLSGCVPNDTAEFNAAQSAGTVEALEAFVAKHPNSKLVPVAMVRLNQAHFEQARQVNTIEAWKAYLARHPESAQAAQARYEIERLAYTAAERANSREALEKFIAEYPGGTFSAAAQKRLEELGGATVAASSP